MWIRLLVIIFLLLAIDFYGWYGLKRLVDHPWLRRYARNIKRFYWFMDLGFIGFSFLWAVLIRNSGWPDHVMYRNYFYITGAFVLIFLPKFVFLIFVLLNDLKLLLRYIIQYINPGYYQGRDWKAPGKLLVSGFVLSVLMLVWVSYGVFYGRYNFKLEQVEVPIENLPEAFDGFRIIQFSDSHLGSFARSRPVNRGLKLIARTPHDVLVFTGDMVNNEAVEALRYVESVRAIESPYGKYAILGNHDMGDYRRWYTIEEKMLNLEQLEDIQASMGFDLLRNQHDFIVKGQDSIMVIGIDNWGLPPFAQYGDLNIAMGDHPDFPYKILLSHDPSHWRAQVLPETDIQLMLAGHTHGMQAGILTPWFNWSLSAMKYPEWYGLYTQNNQHLYVNRGFGFLGFPGRLGMPPEITLLILRRK